MRAIAVALALLVPLPAFAGYVIHPSPGDPNPPAIVATSGKFHPITTFVLDRFGQAWEYVPSGWTRSEINDPPLPLSEVIFWEEGGFITNSGELWHWLVDHWESRGLPPSADSAPEGPTTVTSEIRSAPNPATDATRISFSLPSPGRVSVRLFDATGRLVRTLPRG